jgi:hypothetical protein
MGKNTVRDFVIVGLFLSLIAHRITTVRGISFKLLQ